MQYILLIIIQIFGAGELASEIDVADILKKINRLRAEGCFCGEDYMSPVEALSWNETLQLSAYAHAKDMYDNGYFAHTSRRGKDIGQRISSFGYAWKVVGENIAEGQKDFDEVFIDWKNSVSHCRMLMSDQVSELGVAKYDRYWVQHFASPKSLETGQD